MNLSFLTNPSDNDERKSKRGARPSWEFTDTLTRQLMTLGVPFRVAEMICIDQKGIINTCCANKFNVEETALTLFEKTATLYRDEDNNWYFQGKQHD